MKLRSFFIVIQVFLALQLYGQTHSISGQLYDDAVRPLASGTVVLLDPADSTMEFFGITNRQG